MEDADDSSATELELRDTEDLTGGNDEKVRD